MKKMLALGAVVVSLSLGGCGAMPTVAVFAAESAVMAVEATAAAVAEAEAALTATAAASGAGVSVDVNAAEVAAMRAYLEKWVAQARRIDVTRLSAAEQKELIAALTEGARGLRATAGVDRKTAADLATNGAGAAGIGAAGVVDVEIPEPRVAKQLTQEKGLKANDVGLAVSGAKVSGSTKVAKAEAASDVAKVSAGAVASAAEVAASVEMAENVAALAVLATAQVRKPAARNGSVGDLAASTNGSATAATDGAEVAAGGAEAASEIDVPKTGVNESEQTSSAVRGMGLVLGGAVVLAAAGAVLIVKRMKRGL